MANNKIFSIQEHIVGGEKTVDHGYATSYLEAKKAIKVVASRTVNKLLNKEDIDESVPLYAFGQVTDVPRDGYLLFRHEDPKNPALSLVKREAGYLYGYYEKALSTFDLKPLDRITARSASPKAATTKSVSAAAPARIAVTHDSSDSEKKEAEKRERLYEEVTTSLGKLRIRKKIIDGRDEFHNEIVQKRLEMERRNQAE